MFFFKPGNFVKVSLILETPVTPVTGDPFDLYKNLQFPVVDESLSSQIKFTQIIQITKFIATFKNKTKHPSFHPVCTFDKCRKNKLEEYFQAIFLLM